MDVVYVKIPKLRIGAVIGKQGATRKELEELGECKILVDSSTGDVELQSEKSDALVFYKMEQVIKAIGRGFSPDHAKLLLDDSIILDIINIKELGLKTERSIHTRKARVIGSQGTIRKFIEDSLDCYISIQGKTIAIIGETKHMRLAHEAIMRILKGSNISSVKKYIESTKKELEHLSNTDSNYLEEEEQTEKDILD